MRGIMRVIMPCRQAACSQTDINVHRRIVAGFQLSSLMNKCSSQKDSGHNSVYVETRASYVTPQATIKCPLKSLSSTSTTFSKHAGRRLILRRVPRARNPVHFCGEDKCRFSDCGCPSPSIWRRISRPRFMFETTHRTTFPAFRSH